MDEDDGTVVFPDEIRDYQNAELIMHYQHETECIANEDETHSITCNNEGVTEAHAYVELNCCYMQCKVCDYIKQSSSHNYTYSFTSFNNTKHYAYCECGESILSAHTFVENAIRRRCVKCGYTVALSHTHSYMYLSCYDGANHRRSCSCGESSVEPCTGVRHDDGRLHCEKCGQIVGDSILSMEDDELTMLMEKFSFYVDLHT